MKRTICSILLLATAACSNKAESKLRAVAERANPVLIALRKPAAVILSPESAPAQVVSACDAGISIAQHLRGLDLQDQNLGSDGALSVEDVLYGFSIEQTTRCNPDSEDGTHQARCVSWCRERFGQLVDAVDRVRTQADKEGIKIEVLR